MYVIDVRDYTDNAPGLVADSTELRHGICPRQMAIQRILSGKELLRQISADNRYGLRVIAVAVVEVAPG